MVANVETLSNLLTRFGGNGKEGTSSDGGQPDALCYLRCSSIDSDEQAQKADIVAYAERHAIPVPEDVWYSDEGVKANDDISREAFWRMIERAKSDGQVKWILVREDSRFYRNKTKARQLKDELRQHGVTVVNVTSPHDADSATGTLIESINETLPEVNSRQSRDWTINRMRHHCQQLVDPNRPELGRWKNGGPAAFGYKIENKDRNWDSKRNAPRQSQYWIPDDSDNAGRPCHDWVRFILVDLYAGQGLGYNTIARKLNDLGVKPARAEYFSHSTIRQMTTLETVLTYAGCYIWGKRQHKWLGERISPKKRSFDDRLVVEEAHPPILTVDEVASILDVKHQHATNYAFGSSAANTHDSPYLLTGGLGKCRSCGSNLVGHAEKVKGKTKRWYRCGSWPNRGGAGCAGQFWVPQPLIEGTIHEQIRAQLSITARQAASWGKRVNAYLDQERSAQRVESKALNKELKRIKTQLMNVVNAIKAGVLTVTLSGEAQQLERREAEIERKLIENRTEAESAAPVTANDVLGWSQDLQKTLDCGTSENRRDFIRGFVKEVWTDPESKKVEVTYWRWDEPSTCELVVAPRVSTRLGNPY